MRATDFVGFLLAVAFSPRLGRAKTVLLPGSSGLYGTPIFRPLTCQADSIANASLNIDIDIGDQETAHDAQDSQSWEVRESPGKGLGVFATRLIYEGERIMVEEPLFTVTPPTFVPGRGYELSAMAASVDAAVAELSLFDRELFRACHAHFLPGEKDKVRETGGGLNMIIFRSNAYTLTDGNVAMFPRIARINHSCQPNVANVWSPASGRRIIWAARKIAEGEEITVTYAPLLKSRKDRQARLDPYGFTCDCEACRNHERTDEVRVKKGQDLAELQKRVPWISGKNGDHPLVNDAFNLWIFLLEENMMDYLPDFTHLMADLFNRLGDPESTEFWAEQALMMYEHADENSHAAKFEREYLKGIRAKLNGEAH
ncbi:hypothetical protein KJ359_006045 [Pestalotiopsis sp. 9143b]|nr:hypothetical protein KJ359_006045 [Pestalotiopsis sp. 9143b]